MAFENKKGKEKLPMKSWKWMMLLLLMGFGFEIQAQQPVAADLQLQPNPAHHYATAHFEVPAGTGSVSLFNLVGQKIRPSIPFTSEGGSGSVVLDLNGLPAGVYLVRLQQNQQMAVRRLTVQ
jgi:hypothetical protein